MEVLIANGRSIHLWVKSPSSGWARRGSYRLGWCSGEPERDARGVLRDQRLGFAPPRWPDLIVPSNQHTAEVSHLEMERNCASPG